jgi:SAM-dependent methyltransferase
MGIAYPTARFLVDASRGANFGRTLTLGRQRLYLNKADLACLARQGGFDASTIERCAGPWADDFLQAFAGASSVSALDYSAYEQADVIHDMNAPMPAEFDEQFDTVIDGGTLEHVFNFPVALATCMRLVRTGGRLFLFAPANSQMGHGFYQFSPELLYRALAPEHGFEVERMEAIRFRHISTELGTIGRPLEVVDPAQLATRTVVASKHPVSLYVRARKTRHMEQPFATVPQQSDYVAAWSASPVDRPDTFGARLFSAVSWRLPGAVKWPLWNTYGRLYRNTLRNRRWFPPVRRRLS